MALRGDRNPPKTTTEGKKTNPTTSTVMADTGALPYECIYQVRAILGASDTATFQIQHRNAANDANQVAVVVYVPANASGEYLVDVTAAAGERVRVMMDANLTGTAAATLNYEVLS